MRTFALAITALLLLTSCSDEPTPIEPKTSASASQGPPSMPPRAHIDTPSGAATFVAYWVKVSNFASQTGNTDQLSRISAKECDGCQTYIELYEKTYEEGGYFRGSEWKISDVKIQTGETEHLVLAHVDAPVGTFKQTRESKIGRGNAEDSDLVFGVSWADESWQMTQLGLESELAQ